MTRENFEKRCDKLAEHAKKRGVELIYSIEDTSVQKELRINVLWALKLPEEGNPLKSAPRPRAGAPTEIYARIVGKASEIENARVLAKNQRLTRAAASKSSKNGIAKRNAAEKENFAQVAREIAADLKRVSGLKNVRAGLAKIDALRRERDELMDELKIANRREFHRRKGEIAEEAYNDKIAFAGGRLWEMSERALKEYFQPPFARNYLSATSKQWRAVLFLELKSTAWKDFIGWRHKLIVTGRAYLCGIDDDDSTWSHEVHIDPDTDVHGDAALSANSEMPVEAAMAASWQVPESEIALCTRQGDLLFRPVRAGAEDREMLEPVPEGRMQINGSHTIHAQALTASQDYIAAPAMITITHREHLQQILPAGEYCVHRLPAD